MCSVAKKIGYADGFKWLSTYLKWLDQAVFYIFTFIPYRQAEKTEYYHNNPY